VAGCILGIRSFGGNNAVMSTDLVGSIPTHVSGYSYVLL